ncbi:isoleucyl-tRNA synthetase [Salsuginibacillus halophilus]|uniref:Isoleucine--tRNA ligase n=1 Tax=Salsuginibacillus halophilus TaxID=517424 RepID=A0A2P8HX67_9BACI|nr:isoleucine--tRNA ligase [Salsuginibacillus halophilus]PSL50755.1 isoleucyl-tRNA synthetase [Salsuginibacillus halophilus]
MNYKDTLRMPKTKFPMRGNLPNKEPERQQAWEEMNLYERVQKRTEGRPLFVLHDGPPYANGDIHMGHALNKILKDFIVRYKSMNGYHAPYVPGWDTHGLPIETALTKNEKVDRKEMSVAEFRKKCEAYAMKQLERQREQFKRLGIRGDWEDPYVTLTPAYEAQQIQVFGEMAKQGHIYQGKKPVHWSPSSESALAEAEIEYHDKRSPSIYVSFDVKDGRGVLSGDEKFVIWTTTPWTIPANLAIAVHPELDYAVVEADGSRYIVGEELVEQLSELFEWENVKTVATYKGRELENVKAAHPLYNRESLVILGDHVTLDAGTGCVHTAPGHGEDDFVVGKSYGLDVLCPVDDRGYFTNEAPGYEGLFYDTANKNITEDLKAAAALLKLEFMTHSYPHDWRTKKPVIFRATTQWFASIENIRDELLEAVKGVEWHPGWGETRLYNMVRDRGDWCISRQRAWGVPIPVFYAEDHTPIIEDETIQHVAKLFREHGSNIWFEWETKDLLPEGFTSQHSPNHVFTREMDIMDVWFDSGSSHQAVLKERDELDRPADVYLEGSDQYRGWFNSSLSTSVAVSGEAPYKAVVSHGFALDGEGQKMSKSLGNVVVPNEVMKQLGADILRLWTASVDYQADVRISDAILKQVAEGYRKIRNTFRFLLGNLSDFDPASHRVERSEMAEIDRYMLVRLNKVIEDTKRGYDNYQFSHVYQAVHNFCTIDLSSFYMDVAKDTLYVEPEDDKGRRAKQTVMYDTLLALVKLMTPVIPHTTEEVWSYMPGELGESVQLTDMPQPEKLPEADALKDKWDRVMLIRDDVLKALENARNEKVIGKSLEASISLYAAPESYDVLKNAGDLKTLFIVSGATLEGAKEEAPEDAAHYEHVAVIVREAEGEKCERCWHVKDDIGASNDHPALCKRCADVVETHYPEAGATE